MPLLVVTTREGETGESVSAAGNSVMETIRDAGLSADAHDLLDGSGHRRAASRLSRQIPFGEALDGLAVTIAPED